MEKENFNVFKNFGLTENQHSNLLKRLLHPNGKHKQNLLFLEEFYKIIGIDSEHLGNNKITVETEVTASENNKGRADLVIEDGEYTIIIENKIKDAENQPNQLYRYWKNLISLKKREKYKIIYLVRDSKEDVDFGSSITKPNNQFYQKKYPDLPLVIQDDDILVISYKDDISDWLKRCLLKIPQTQDNQRLISTLEQYIEWIEKWLISK